MIKKAMILGAGFGTRLKPWTDHHPKALARVNGKSLLQRNVEYLSKAGINEIVINTHHFPEQIIEEVQINKGWGSKLQIIYEEEILETGGGLVNAANHLKTVSDFILMNVDILTDMNIREMVAFHQQHQPLATLAVSNRNSSRCFLFDAEGRLSGWKNKQTGEEKISRQVDEYHELAFSGIHIINSEIFNNISRKGKFSMVDWYLDLAADHKIMAYVSHAAFLDVGKPGSIKLAETKFD